MTPRYFAVAIAIEAETAFFTIRHTLGDSITYTRMCPSPWILYLNLHVQHARRWKIILRYSKSGKVSLNFICKERSRRKGERKIYEEKKKNLQHSLYLISNERTLLLYLKYFLKYKFSYGLNLIYVSRWNIDSLKRTEREIVTAAQVVKVEWRRTIEEIRDPLKLYGYLLRGRDVSSRGVIYVYVYVRTFIYRRRFCAGKAFMSLDYSQRKIGLSATSTRVFDRLLEGVSSLPERDRRPDAAEIKLASLGFRVSRFFIFTTSSIESIMLFAITLIAVNRVKVNGVK